MKEKNFGVKHTFNTVNPETGAAELTEYSFERPMTRREAWRVVKELTGQTLSQTQKGV